MILLIEEWRDITGFENYYQVSNLGNVRSLDRYITKKNGTTTFYKGKILIPSKKRNGYLAVDLYDKSNHKPHTVTIHRLVAKMFISNPNNYEQINHKDGNKTNNSILNLEWCDRSYNIKHAFDNNLMTTNGYIRNKKVAQINKNTNEIICIYESISEAARMLKLHNQLISQVCKGSRKTTGGYKWIYVNDLYKAGENNI